MVEGDTVYQAGRRLEAALAGRVLESNVFRVPGYRGLDLAGRRVGSVVSRGKHVLIRVGNLIVHTNLAFGGRWETYAPGERARTPILRAGCVLRNADFRALGFDLGLLQVMRASEEPRVFGGLGPDPLGSSWDPAEAARRLASDRGRAIGLALLDQRLISGIGDVYRSETLFLAKTNPLAPVGSVADLPRLVDLAHGLLQENKDRARRLTAPFSHGKPYWVHGRAGRPCPCCGAGIAHDILGSWFPAGHDPERPGLGSLAPLDPQDVAGEPRGRDVYWCPECQPLPTGSTPGPAGATRERAGSTDLDPTPW